MPLAIYVCSDCGYDLRGQTDLRCPECGQGRAGGGTSLQWARALYRGAVLQAGALGCALLFAMAEIVKTPLSHSKVNLYSIGKLLVSALLFSAIFLLTAQDPQESFTEKAVSLRRILRLIMIIAVVVGAVQFASVHSKLSPVLSAVQPFLEFAGVFAVIMFTVYMKHLAMRLRERRLALFTGVMILVTGLSLVLYMIWGAWSLVVRSGVFSSVAATVSDLITRTLGAATALQGLAFIPFALFCLLAFRRVYLSVRNVRESRVRVVDSTTG